MVKIETYRSIDEIKYFLKSSYPIVVDKGNKVRVFKSDWVSMGLKFKDLGDRIQVKTYGDMPGGTAAIFVLALVLSLIGGLVVAIVYNIYARAFIKEVISRIQTM